MHQGSVLARPTAQASLAFVCLIAVLPFLQPLHNLPIPSFYSEWLAFTLGTAACIAFLLRQFWNSLVFPRVALHLAGIVLILVLQSAWIDYPYASQRILPAFYTIWAIWLAVLASWLRQFIGTEYVIEVFAWGFLCTGVLHALVGLAQYLDQPGLLAAWIDYHPGGALSGNLGQANHYATHLMLASIALLYLFARARLSSYLAISLLALFVFFLALSMSRSVILYALALIVFSIAGYYKTRTPVQLRFAWMSILLFVLFMLAQYALPVLGEWLNNLLLEFGFRLNKLGTTIEKLRAAGGIDLRLSEWHKAWLMFSESPLLGIGFGNYGWYSFMYQSTPEFAAIGKAELFHHSHNMFTQVLAEMGGIGLLLLIALLVGWTRQYARSWLQPTHWFIGACLLVLFIHSNLEYPLWYSYFLGIAAVLLGLGDGRTIKISFTPWLGQVAAGVVLVLVGAILGITFTGYQKLANVNTLILATNPEQAANTLRQVAANPLLRPWAEATMATHGIADKSKIEEQLALTTRVMLHHPDPIKVRRQIQYLALAGRTDQAIALLQQAAIAYEFHLPSYICAWQSLPDAEIRPIVQKAQQLTNKSVRCSNE